MGQSRNAGALIRAMLALRTERRTGVLRVDADGVRTFVYLLKGAPVFAEEGTLGETLGRLLVRQRLLTQEQYIQAIERMTRAVFENEQMRFGEVAVELGFLTGAQVHRALADQVRWKIIRAFQREEPEWTFTDSEGDLESVAHFALPIESLVLDAARWFPDEQKQELVLGPVLARFPSVRGDPTLLAERFEMAMEEMRFVATLDGTRTVAEMLDMSARATGRTVDVAALLTALVLLGAVELGSVKKDSRIAGAVLQTATHGLDALSPPSRGPYPSTPPPPASNARERAAKAVMRLKAARDESRKKHAPPSTRPPANEHEARLLAEQAFQKGKAHLRANHLALAAPELARAFELDPKSIEYELYARWSTSRLSTSALEPRELGVLRALSIKAMKVDPNFAFAYYVLGHCALTEGADVVARRCFQQALKIDPTAIDAERHIRILARRGSQSGHGHGHAYGERRAGEGTPPIVVPPPIVAVAPPPPPVVVPPAPVAPPVVVAPVVAARSRGRAILWIGVGCLGLLTAVAFAAVTSKQTTSVAVPPPLPPPPPPPPQETVSVAVPTPTPTVTATEEPVVPEPPSTTGRVILPEAAAGHRVFVDDRVVSDGKDDLVLPCGAHKLRIGSAGKTVPIEVPCGGDLNLRTSGP